MRDMEDIATSHTMPVMGGFDVSCRTRWCLVVLYWVEASKRVSRMLRSDARVEAFTDFVATYEVKLRGALTATLGSEVGREAAAEAMAYGWEHWDRVSALENPIGYLYQVGRNRGGRIHGKRQLVFPPSQIAGDPWVEPGLPAALAGLPERQRAVVWLLHSADWTMSEVAGILGISKSSVQKHDERGLAKLRRTMGVTK